MMVNLPLEKVESAGLRLCSDGTGDVLFTPTSDAKLYYMLLWPHVRLLGLRRVQPLFRGIPDAQNVARLLAKTVRDRGIEGGVSSPHAPEPDPANVTGGYEDGQPLAVS